MAGRAKPSKLIWHMLLASACALPLASQTPKPEYEANPREFVRSATHNEATSHGDRDHYMWKDTERKAKGTTTKLMIETPQGIISRMILVDGRPLNSDERSQDDARVGRLLSDPSALKKKQQEQKDDEEHATKLLSAIPDAFLFHLVGVEEVKGGKAVHYTFEPDPNFDPPNHEARVFEGMKGDLFIDMNARRIAKIDAELFKPVEFGWGILGKLDKGGRFLIEQQCVGGTRWETTHSVLHFFGKALMVKTINIQEDDTLFDFQRVQNNLSLAEAMDVMKKADDVVAQNGGGNGER